MDSCAGCSKLRIKQLYQPLQCSASLTSLCLSGNRLTCHDAKALAPILSSRSCKLESLSLSGNSISDDGARVMFFHLRNNTSLTKLDLSVNQITARGLKDCPILSHDSQCGIELLSLSSNLLQDQGIATVATMLAQGYSWLRCVDLADNESISLSTIQLLREVEESRGFGWNRERILWIGHCKPNDGCTWFSQMSTHVLHIVLRFANRSIRFKYSI